MGHLSVRRVVVFALVAAVAAIGFVLLGPAQLGGPARYAIIDGTSMVPTLTDGDLAIVRVDGELEKGEIALYRDPRLGVDVLHRIVRKTGDRFVLKGDNNDYLDDARPTAAELGGTLWFSVPYLGSGIEWVRQPLHAALAVFVFFALAFAGGTGATRRRTRTRHAVGIVPPGTHLDGALRGRADRRFRRGPPLRRPRLRGVLAVLDAYRDRRGGARPSGGALLRCRGRAERRVPGRDRRVRRERVPPARPRARRRLRLPVHGPTARAMCTARPPITATVSDGAGWLRRVEVAPRRGVHGAERDRARHARPRRALGDRPADEDLDRVVDDRVRGSDRADGRALRPARLGRGRRAVHATDAVPHG